MIAAARPHSWVHLRAPPGAWRRALVAGTAWGIVMGGVLTALEAWRCGFVCVPDAALTTAFSIAAGLCTMGPLAAFGARGPARER